MLQFAGSTIFPPTFIAACTLLALQIGRTATAKSILGVTSLQLVIAAVTCGGSVGPAALLSPFLHAVTANETSAASATRQSFGKMRVQENLVRCDADAFNASEQSRHTNDDGTPCASPSSEANGCSALLAWPSVGTLDNVAVA